ncbi:hypothetical protein Taro_026478, partial [Colocasia esculenta]|nr:hypothetical protein [Colocasia esculenta]
FGLRVRVGVSRRLRYPTCGVTFTRAGLLPSASLLELSRFLVCCVAPLVEHCDTCLWLLPALCWLVVNSSEVLPEFFSVGSGGEPLAIVLVRVALRTVLGLFLPVNGALVVLVEVLPEPVVLLSLAAVFSLLAVCFGYFFGLHSGDVFPERLLALWVEVLPKLPCVVPLAVCLTVVLARFERFASFLVPCVLCQMVV